LKKLLILFFFCIALAVTAPLLMREVFFRMPAYSASFDCDDGTLLMMERFQSIGITSNPVLGNLKMNGEKYAESDHVWLMADIAGCQIAFDRGAFYPDRQHYEGFLISKQQLLDFVAQDLDPAGQAAGHPAGR
jgi:hypothetical protein